MHNSYLKYKNSLFSFNFLLFLKFFCWILIFLVTSLISLPSTPLSQTPRSKIDSDIYYGKIDINQAVIYKVYSIFAPQKLPYKYRQDIGEKCATSELREILNLYPRLNDETKKLISPYLKFQIPSNLTETFTTEHFVIYYTKDPNDIDCVLQPNLDDNQNGHPDYVDYVANYFEESYEYLIATDKLGYNPPPYTYYYPYRAYIADIGNYYGFCSYNEKDTLIAIHNTMDLASSNDDPEGKTKGALKVTIAHELFHAVKAGYDWDEDENYGYWWDEATSVWVEDIIYPYVNDYIRYIDNWFSHPEYSLDYSGAYHMYGSCIFAKYLTESHQYLSDNFGQDIIKKIWERCAVVPGGRSILSIKEELEQRGYTLSSVFKNFAVANYLKDYIDGERFPNIATSSINRVLTADRLTLEFAGNTDTSWGGKIILIKSEGTKQIVDYPIDDISQQGELQIDDARRFSQALFIVNNSSLDVNSNYSYTNNIAGQSNYSLSYLATHYHLFQIPPFSIISCHNYPNPFIGDKTNFVTEFTGRLPNYVVIEIYNLAQKLIERITDINPAANISNNTYTYQWQPKFKLSNGVYLYRITFFSNNTSAFSKTGKMVVLR